MVWATVVVVAPTVAALLFVAGRWLFSFNMLILGHWIDITDWESQDKAMFGILCLFAQVIFSLLTLVALFVTDDEEEQIESYA